MIKLVINDVEAEAELNETLLEVARRQKSHIGYTCGGNGACQTCEVIVSEGMDALSEINDIEKSWLTPIKQDEGHRLACQATIIKDDVPIELTSRVQVLLNIFNHTFNESAEKSGLKPNPMALKDLVEYVGKETVSHLATTPAAVTNSMFRIFEGNYKPEMIYETLKAWREQTQDIKPDVELLKEKLTNLAENKPQLPNLPELFAPIIDKSKPIFKQVNEAVTNIIESQMMSSSKNIGANQVQRIEIEKKEKKHEMKDK